MTYDIPHCECKNVYQCFSVYLCEYLYYSLKAKAYRNLWLMFLYDYNNYNDDIYIYIWIYLG